MVEDTQLNNLIYQKIINYRYRIADESVTIMFHNKELVKSLKQHNQHKFHPYFQINSFSVEAKVSYCWDGATFTLNTPNLIIPSLMHDIGCQAINLGHLPRECRKHFDREYYEQCLLYGVNKYRANLHYVCIRLWGMIPKSESLAPYAKKFTIKIK